MPISKFGLSDQRNDDDSFHRWNGIVRNYVYENALCCVAIDFDAKSCKIQRVALPVDDDNVVNKRFVQQNMQILKDRQDEIEKNMQILKNGQDDIEKNITSLQTNRQVQNYLLKNIQTFENQLNLLEKKMNTIQYNIQGKNIIYSAHCRINKHWKDLSSSASTLLTNYMWNCALKSWRINRKNQTRDWLRSRRTSFSAWLSKLSQKQQWVVMNDEEMVTNA